MNWNWNRKSGKLWKKRHRNYIKVKVNIKGRQTGKPCTEDRNFSGGERKGLKDTLVEEWGQKTEFVSRLSRNRSGKMGESCCSSGTSGSSAIPVSSKQQKKKYGRGEQNEDMQKSVLEETGNTS